jgi:hypothetical protein
MSRQKVRDLNDALRQHGIGGDTVKTHSVAALTRTEQATIIAAIRAFDAFNADNDPHGEHDCATLTVGAHEVMFKIDYYDPSMESASDDPADPAKTNRVMTVMLAGDY